MANTAFSIELQGLDLPNELKLKLQSDLQNMVLSEIAKTDLGKQVSVEPLPGSSERRFLPGGWPPVLGFIVRNLLSERGTDQPSTGMPPILSGQGRVAHTMPFDDASSSDVLEALYYRPDVRAAIASNSQAFVELLSHDEQAARVFNELTGGTGGTERVAPLLIYGLAVAAGAAAGYFSRK
jgi:hypothetical protein